MVAKWYWYIPTIAGIFTAVWSHEPIKWILTSVLYTLTIKYFGIDNKVIGQEIKRRSPVITDFRRLR